MIGKCCTCKLHIHVLVYESEDSIITKNPTIVYHSHSIFNIMKQDCVALNCLVSETLNHLKSFQKQAPCRSLCSRLTAYCNPSDLCCFTCVLLLSYCIILYCLTCVTLLSYLCIYVVLPVYMLSFLCTSIVLPGYLCCLTCVFLLLNLCYLHCLTCVSLLSYLCPSVVLHLYL